MEIPGINSSSSFDISSFLNKTNNKNNLSNDFGDDEATQSGTQGMSASNFLDKSDSIHGQNMYTEQADRLNTVLAMALAGQDVGGLLENVQSLSALEAAEETLDEITTDIETKANEAMSEDTAIEEQIEADAENAVAADGEGQVTVDADGEVIVDSDAQVSTDSGDKVVTNAGEQPVNDSSNTAEASADTAKPTQESVDLYV